MSNDPSLGNRQRALEESFFAGRQGGTPERPTFPSSVSREEQRQSLAAASGINDALVLDHLLEAGFRAETITALGIVPLLAVGWADGHLEAAERQAVLAACESEGIVAGSVCIQFLEQRFGEHPNPGLLADRKDFIQLAGRQRSREAIEGLRDDVLERATKIAQASRRGTLPGGSAEARVLAELRDAFRVGQGVFQS